MFGKKSFFCGALCLIILLGFSNERCSSATLVEVSLQTREKLLSQTKAAEYLKSPWQNQSQLPPPTLTPSPYPWKKNIMTTIFWVGERATRNNPVPNNKSSWDSKWMSSYGGYDCPKNRIGYRPSGFIPKENPFYVALPYNDVGQKGTKPEAPKVIPWFDREFEENGKSVVKGRWLAIHYKGRVCYAQWEDVGPYRTDHWQYVFGRERPSPNRNGGAGLDVSPAVRDYLGMSGNDLTDWKFVEVYEVPNGPWTKYGVGNPLSPYYSNRLSSMTASAN